MRYNLASLYFKHSLVTSAARIPSANLTAGISRLILGERHDLQLLNLRHGVACAARDRAVDFQGAAFEGLVRRYLWGDLSRDLLFLLFLQDDVERTQMLLTRNKRLQPSVRVPVTRAQDGVIVVTRVVSSHLRRLEESLGSDLAF